MLLSMDKLNQKTLKVSGWYTECKIKHVYFVLVLSNRQVSEDPCGRIALLGGRKNMISPFPKQVFQKIQNNA